MTSEEILEYVSENNPEATMFRNPNFIDAIVGWIENEEGLPVLCYDYNKMIECLAAEYEAEADTSEDDRDFVLMAIEWIDYNTLRTLPYMGSSRPIILYN